MEEVISQNFSLFQALEEVDLHRIYRQNIPNDYLFSSKLQKTVKTSPCFKFVGLPLEINIHVYVWPSKILCFLTDLKFYTTLKNIVQ